MTKSPSLFQNAKLNRVTSPIRLFENPDPPPVGVAVARQVMPPSDPLPVAKLNISSSKSLPPPRNHHVLPNLGIAPPHKHHALPYQHEFAKLPPTRPDYEGASASVGNFYPSYQG